MTILNAVRDPKLFKPWFTSDSWWPWMTFLKVLFGLPLEESDRTRFQQCTKRSAAPRSPFREAWVVVGRRGGKSLIASLVAVFLACFKDYSDCLKPGEVGTVMVLAADRRQARTILRYVKGFFELPILKKLVVNETQESIELSHSVVIEIHTASFRSVRGYTLLAVIADEIAFWRSEDTPIPIPRLLRLCGRAWRRFRVPCYFAFPPPTRDVAHCGRPTIGISPKTRLFWSGRRVLVI